MRPCSSLSVPSSSAARPAPEQPPPAPPPTRSRPPASRFSRLRNNIFEVTLHIHLYSLLACVAATTHFAASSLHAPCDSFKFPAKLFSVGWKDGSSSGKWDLQEGSRGADCVNGDEKRCSTCFQRIAETLRKLEDAYRSFDTTLSRFDCLPAVDTASATRPFSPNATCSNCKLWYRRWLLVHSLQIWSRPPCINWCYYTQLACPHLAPAKIWDYAGHPSFQCRDMDIDSWRNDCDCVHPCNVRGVVGPGPSTATPSFRHDFFASQVHCRMRRKQCHTQSTAHERKALSTTVALASRVDQRLPRGALLLLPVFLALL